LSLVVAVVDDMVEAALVALELGLVLVSLLELPIP
jgi:hypothetical protein